MKKLRIADNVAEVDNIQTICTTLAVIYSLILSSLLCLLKENLVEYCDTIITGQCTFAVAFLELYIQFNSIQL